MSSSTTPLNADAIIDTVRRRRWRYLMVLVLFALVVRFGLLLALHTVTHGQEFADDFAAYRAFLRHPLILFNGTGIEEVPDTVIYSPLIPVQVWLIGKPLSNAMGTFYGHRIGMILYDVTAMAVTAWAMIRWYPPTWTRRQWMAALLLMCVPGSLGASALWGQEDCIAAMWTSFAMVALVRGHPTIAALFGGIGLYTHKLFALLLSFGIWLTSPGSRLKIVATTGAVTLVFFLFLFVRWKLTGMVVDKYAYQAIGNSPSPWALIDRLMGGGKLTFASLRPMIIGTTVLAVAGTSLFTLLYRRGRTSREGSVVATHTVFFAVFIGIQPEHHQWFMPFLIYFAWRRFLAGDYLTFAVAWSYSGFAYAYKIAYGLQMRQNMSLSSGKDIFRGWIGNHSADMLLGLQLGFHVLTMLIGILLVYRALTAEEKLNADAEARS